MVKEQIMQKQNWLLTANGSEATIFKYVSSGQSLEVVTALANGMGRKQDQEIVTDRPGVISGGGKNIMGQNALSAEESPSDKAKEDFAKSVVNALEQARREDKLHAIDIIASPEMLGLLRDKMNKSLTHLVDKSVSKDPIEKTERELLKMIAS
jgi:protein required for attachment to host cells